MSRTLRMGKYFGDDGSAGYQTRRRAAYNSRTVRSVMPMSMTSEAAVTEFRFSSIATVTMAIVAWIAVRTIRPMVSQSIRLEYLSVLTLKASMLTLKHRIAASAAPG